MFAVLRKKLGQWIAGCWTAKLIVVRQDHTIRGNQPRGYVDDQWTEQRLVKVSYLFGYPVSKTTMDREIVPEYAVIEQGCFGATSWRSKFAEHINRQNGVAA